MLRALSVLIPLLMANSAFAAVIDFTGSAFAAADGQGTYGTTVEGIGVTLSALPSPDAELTQSADGIGIDYRDWGSAEEQIEGAEVLSLTFDQEVSADELYITNLYEWEGIQIEVGEYTINGESTQFAADSTTGQLTVGVDAAPTTNITVRAEGGWSSWLSNGFSLAGISINGGDVAAVPELDPGFGGAALAMLLGGVMIARRPRRKRG